MIDKAPPHPAASRADFWQREAAIKGAALEAAKRENIELERHYRAALAEIRELRASSEPNAAGSAQSDAAVRAAAAWLMSDDSAYAADRALAEQTAREMLRAAHTAARTALPEPTTAHPDAAEVARLRDEVAAWKTEATRLRAGIEAFQAGDYQNPRQHRPGNCPHGRPYYEDCGACDAEHFTRLLAG